MADKFVTKEEDRDLDGIVDIPNVPDNYHAQIHYLSKEYQHVIKFLAVTIRKGRARPDLIARLKQLLAWMESALVMTPKIRTEAKIDTCLQILTNPQYVFPQQIVNRAISLKTNWENDNWGDNNIDDDQEPDIPEEQTSSNLATNQPLLNNIMASETVDDAPGVIRPPPIDHPVYGEHGIMHGVVCHRSTRMRTYRLNTNYVARNARVYGHNGLTPGAWWPLQVVSLFNGAHGARMAGIAGSTATGAYSVVVSGPYTDLDRDEGETIYYSGSNSHRNADPEFASDSSPGTLALKKSLETGRPVRVLRSSKAHSNFAPSCGLRYDGLYQVVEMLTPLNSNGGRYEQFRLVREPDQDTLEDIWHMSPTPQQIADFALYPRGY